MFAVCVCCVCLSVYVGVMLMYTCCTFVYYSCLTKWLQHCPFIILRLDGFFIAKSSYGFSNGTVAMYMVLALVHGF